jgi:fructuronate reductase
VRLSRATADRLSASVRRPASGNGGPTRRIVHLGLGAFHRAHQAVYTDDAMQAGDAPWAITGVSLRSSAVRDSLAPQDGLYVVGEASGGSLGLRLIGALDTLLVAPEDPQAVIAAIADPATSVVTLTVTEKGYRAETDSPPQPFGTIYDYLTAGLAARQAGGAGGLTLVSCDNLSGNGALLETRLLAALDAHRPSLRAWAEQSIACPNTMVDRIVPAATADKLDRIEAAVGLRDEAAILTEPFRQWVIEDRFAGPRPRWEAGGAQFVEDVAPFELAKLRLLNGSHSTLAYMGRALGFGTVAEAVADPDLRRFLRLQLEAEAMPSLAPTAGLDAQAYVDAILTRFGNADLPHRLDQIAKDGSQKIPQRWLATIVQRAARGQGSALHLASLAAWIADTRGRCGPVDDPLKPRFEEIWSAGRDPESIAQAFVHSTGIFPEAFRGNAGLIGALAGQLRLWLAGPRAAIAATVASAA